ncbi:DoxX family protein [Flavivirga spongiicola]|uniref:DoxX family protein n=1 Tax=Flavivirga spongiicola TaxID=421621 RepID=A0ABU7XWE3_9FLAO|nr:DoxX family protein [Flavivirga sp. MEBiC05379]MDO5979173.1 DoxX family protein [Flavivirga sp. MEBiC05379]
MNKNENLGLLILRISLGVLMLFHGFAKLKGISFIEGVLSEKGLPSLLGYGVYFTEIVAPIAIIIGYRTRLASIVFALGALFALFLVHASDIFTLNQHGGWSVELLGLYLFGAISLFYTGAGKYALSVNNKWD